MTQTPEVTAVATCPQCGEELEPGVNFCEACGAKIGAPTQPGGSGAAAPVSPADEASPISTPTVRHTDVLTEQPPRRPCAECGAAVGDDGYCTVCGVKAPTERDHFEQQPAAWVGGVCDRGLVHTRNEDAMALLADPTPGSRAVLVVCDGVSNSDDSDIASLAAAKAALDVLRVPLPKGLGVAESTDAAATKVFTQAAAAAQTAVIAHTNPSSARPPSCTFATGVVQDGLLRYAVIGDSRVYLLPDGDEGRQLLPDDSMAQALIDGGMPREQAETSTQAHAITKWIGADSPDVVPRTGSVPAPTAGWVVVCSDGLWNYASEPAALRAQVDATGATDPLVVAQRLVAWACSQGGHDNVTVALARLGGIPAVEAATTAAPAQADPAQVAASAAPAGQNATSTEEDGHG